MTNTETVSTERLQKMLDAEIPLGMSIEDARSIITELLASRTQSPAEWQVDAAQAVLLKYVEDRAAIREALRAASIPAPERSKEETGLEMTQEEIRLEDLKMMAQYSGPVVSFEVAEPYYLASCDHCGWVGSSEHCGTDSFGDDSDAYCPRCRAGGADCGKVAASLETPPLHKEGEAVCPDCNRHVMTAPEPATGWIAKCGRRLTRLSECGSGVECEAYPSPSPAPVPVTITDEMVERVCIAHTDRTGGWVTVHRDLKPSHRARMRAALTAALSQKPGEQG